MPEKEILEFVTRLKLNCYQHFNNNINKQTRADNIHKFVKTWYEMRMVKIEDKKLIYLKPEYRAMTVALPDATDKWYTLFVVKGFGEHPMFLLINKKLILMMEIPCMKWSIYISSDGNVTSTSDT